MTALPSPAELIAQLSTTVDPSFARDAVMSYIELQQRFAAGDWTPAELNGGRLCEAVSRALLQMDTGQITHKLLPGDIREKKLLAQNIPHRLSQKDRYHVSKAIEVVYKFRSDRGAVHISPDYLANQIDSVFVLHACKWILAEFMRLAWNADQSVIARVIEQLAQIEFTLIHEYDGKPMVLSDKVSVMDEILLLLHNSANKELSRQTLQKSVVKRTPRAVNAVIQTLASRREVRVEGNMIILTPPGQNRVMSEIVPRLMP